MDVKQTLPIAAVALLVVALALVKGLAKDGEEEGVTADDKTLTLVLLDTAWRQEAGGRDFVYRLDASGQLDIVTWDADAEEEIAARGVWTVKQGVLRGDVHYTDDESVIASGPFEERILALEEGRLRYARTSGRGGPAGTPASGARSGGG